MTNQCVKSLIHPKLILGIGRVCTIAMLATIAIVSGGSPAGAQAETPLEPIKWQTASNAARAAGNFSVQTTTGSNYLTSVITIRNSKAPASYSFELTIPPGQRLVPSADGGLDAIVEFAGGQKLLVGRMDAPWARDAKGKSMPTTLSLNGTTLTQWVNTKGAAYPVTADPHYTWGIITGTVYLNRHETNLLATGVGLAAIGIGAYFGGWGAVPAGGLTAYANYVYNEGHCIKMKLVPAPVPGLFLYYPGEYWGSDGDGYCR